MALSAAGCVKNEVAVEFELSADVSDAYRIIYYASDPAKGWYVETGVALQKGKGKTVLITRNPSLVFIQQGEGVPQVGFYMERGDKIKISGEGSSPLDWKISGNKLSEEWSSWRLENKEALRSRDAGQLNRAVGKYISANPGNPLSTVLLLVYFNRREDEKGFEKYWKMLKGDALDLKWIQLVARSDLSGDEPRFASDVKNLIIHSAGNGADTLESGKKPMLLYFWRRSEPGRQEDIRSLGELSSEWADSSRRIIADICFDPDSIGWRAPLDADSLRNIVRGWNPKGEADSVMMRLGVERTPYVLLFDSKGKNIYRGSDLKEAISRMNRINH